MKKTVFIFLVVFLLAIVSFSAALIAQKNSIQPQPQAAKLAPVSVPTRGNSAPLAKPDGVLPTVPPGFTVSVYAEIRAPRMMVYAPNGDLFVSSPATNSITVLRDTNNDGEFEQRSTCAASTASRRVGGRSPGVSAALFELAIIVGITQDSDAVRGG